METGKQVDSRGQGWEEMTACESGEWDKSEGIWWTGSEGVWGSGIVVGRRDGEAECNTSCLHSLHPFP